MLPGAKSFPATYSPTRLKSATRRFVPAGTGIWKRYISTGSRTQASALPSAVKRRFTRSAMGPVGAWSPGIHLGYTRSMVCASGDATGKDSRAERIFLEMVVASTSRMRVDDFSWARATDAEERSPSHNRPSRTHFDQIRGNWFTPLPAGQCDLDYPGGGRL